MLRDCSVRSKLPTANLLVVGDAESGKTALLSRLDDGKSGGSHVPSSDGDGDGHAHAVDTLLSYSTINVIDPKAKESGGDASDVEDVMAKIGTWSLNDLNLKDLINIAVKPHTLQKVTLPQTVVAIVVDLSRPWTIKSSLEQVGGNSGWLSALEGELLQQINQLAPEMRNELYSAIKQHLLAYEDPVRPHKV
ncbi:hypothetical protein BBJ28_00016419 [Nothophytophthora sp. Chile5]|nr:hypothetical protein BBJ28_00016419 [Nothophytophthora sp. Chile5]